MDALSDTAEQILRRTRRLILAGGYDGFSYADVAEVVGIRKASIHHHFPTKAELVRVLVSRYREEAAAGMVQLNGLVPDPADRLRAYVGYWQTCISTDSGPFCVCALLASQMPLVPEEVAIEVRAHFRTLAAWLAEVLAEGAAQGRFGLANDAAVEAEIFVATVHGAMLSSRAHSNPELFGAIVQPLIQRIIV